jgi:hypothetical protein
MKYASLFNLSLLLAMSLPGIGHAQGSSPASAIPLVLPAFQDSWAFEGKMGQRYVVPLRKPGDLVWYSFQLEDDLVIYAAHLGGQGNQASVEVLDKSLTTIAKSGTNELLARLICNQQLKKGSYFIKVTSIAQDGKPLQLELCKFTKNQTKDAVKLIKTRQQLAERPTPTFTASQLVGRWRHIDQARKLTTNLSFQPNGTFTGNIERNGQANGTFAGKWRLKQDILLYEYTASSDPGIPAGVTDQDRLVEITKDRYTIENALGLEGYVRIK